jgi:signal transduction histidine kinase
MRSLSLKFIFAFLAVGLTGTALVAIFAGLSTRDRFNDFLFDQNREGFVTQLASYYEQSGSWVDVHQVFPFTRPRGPMGPKWAQEGGPFTLVDGSGHVVVAGPGHQIGMAVHESDLDRSVPIKVDGQEVGRLIVGRGAFEQTIAERDFVNRSLQTIALAAIGAVTVALLLGIILTRTLTRPLRELTQATQAVAKGDLEQVVPVRSKDELGLLAESFNQMNTNLARSRDLRRQMTADIAHELRTPLSVILGHTEAIKDGVMPPSQETFDIIHDESMRLSSMVEDLRTLSLAEAGELPFKPRPYSIKRLLDDIAAGYAPRAKQKSIEIEVVTAASSKKVILDSDRMTQVLRNLMENALRFTPEGGRITLSAENIAGNIFEIRVQDSGPGVEPDKLDLIFDRFYREDKSRQREEGSSGLGLAIAKSIVEGHGGTIRAESAPGQGMKFIIHLQT